MWSGLGDRLAGLGDALTERASAHVKQRGQTNGGSGGGEGTVVDLPPLNETTVEFTAASPSTTTAATSSPSEGVSTTAASIGASSTPLPSSSSSPSTSSVAGEDPGASSTASSTVVAPTNGGVGFRFAALRNWTENVAEATKRTVEATRESVELERARIQASAPSLFQRGAGGPYKRDLNLPLDVEALRDAEVVYVTDRILTFSHPHLPSTTDGSITAQRKLAAVGHLLSKRHAGRYMVWNLSEVDYDFSAFDDQVLTFRFPGSPSPPLGMLLKLLLSLESWLVADSRNVVALHCLTGRGRTSTVLAALLCWTGEAGFRDVNVALEYIARCKRLPAEALTIPSQVRYASYFANMLDGVRPSRPPLLLKRIVLSEAPKFGKRPAPSSTTADGNSTDEGAKPEHQQLGCAPYLQVFKAGNLVFTTAATVNYAQSRDDLPWCVAGDGHPVSFPVETVVRGDVLVRCRHLTRGGQRVSMFRCAFHTGYVPPKVLRLTKAQLDGACVDRRFGDDFFVDLIFEACDGATASKLLAEEAAAGGDAGGGGHGSRAATVEGGGEGGVGGNGSDATNEAVERRAMGTIAATDETTTTAMGTQGEPSAASSAPTAVSASAYDSMLHRDSRFWDVISERRKENEKKLAATAEAERRSSEAGGDEGKDSKKKGEEVEGEGKSQEEKKSGGDAAGSSPTDAPSMWGPTIGKRRDFAPFSQRRSGGMGGDGNDEGTGNTTGGGGGGQNKNGKGKRQNNPMGAFSIGGDLEFGSELSSSSSRKDAAVADGNGGGKAHASSSAVPSAPEPKQRDSLMEALMGLDDPDDVEDDAEDDGDNEIVFDTGDDDDGDGDGVPLALQTINDTEAVGEVPTGSAEPTSTVPGAVSDASTEQGGNTPASSADTTTTTAAAAVNDAEKVSEEHRATSNAGGIAAATMDKVAVDDNVGVVANVLGVEAGDLDDELDDDDDEAFDDLGIDLGDMDLDDDDDDSDMEDLENFLTQVSSGK